MYSSSKYLLPFCDFNNIITKKLILIFIKNILNCVTIIYSKQISFYESLNKIIHKSFIEK